MGFFDEIKKLAHPYDDEDEFFDRGTPEEEQPGPPIVPERRESFFTDEEDAEPANFGLPKPSFPLPRRDKEHRAQPKQAEAPAQQRQPASGGGQGLMLAKPAEFADAAGIADSFAGGRTIVLDLGSADKVTARRVIDFLSGVAYALGGTLSRISGGIYLVTPSGVNISGEMMSQIESGGLSF